MCASQAIPRRLVVVSVTPCSFAGLDAMGRPTFPDSASDPSRARATGRDSTASYGRGQSLGRIQRVEARSHQASGNSRTPFLSRRGSCAVACSSAIRFAASSRRRAIATGASITIERNRRSRSSKVRGRDAYPSYAMSTATTSPSPPRPDTTRCASTPSTSAPATPTHSSAAAPPPCPETPT